MSKTTNKLYLTNKQREFLLAQMDSQLTDRDEAFQAYFRRHQATVRPQLERQAPVQLDREEVRYLLFTLGQAAATASTYPARARHWAILEKVIKLNEPQSEEKEKE